jgi:hypothetical protein
MSLRIAMNNARLLTVRGLPQNQSSRDRRAFRVDDSAIQATRPMLTFRQLSREARRQQRYASQQK